MIYDVVWDPVDLTQYHAHGIYVEDFDACKIYDFLHAIFPYLVGAGMMWASTFSPLDSYRTYMVELRETAAADALARANPMDGQAQQNVKDNSARVLEFKNWIQKNFVDSGATWSPWAMGSPAIVSDALVNHDVEVQRQMDAFLIGMETIVEASTLL